VTGFTTINVVRVQYNNSSCGTALKLVESFDTSPKNDISDGKKIYICFGNNPESKDYAITDLTVNSTIQTTTNVNNEIKESLTQDLGKDNGNTKYIYLTRSTKAPRKVLIKNYEITRFERDDMTLPTQVDSIVVSGSSVKKTLTSTTSTEVTKTSTFEFGVSVNVSVTAGSEKLGFEATLGVSANYNYSSTTTKTNTKENSDSQEVTCSAVPKKTMRCTITKNTQRVIAYYTYRQEFFGYNEDLLAFQTITGSSESKESKSLSIFTCCESGCCEGDKVRDAGKSQCFNSKGEVKAKDFKCTDYDLCVKSAVKTYNASTAAQTVTLTTSASAPRVFR
jgi:hypothetical protein